VGQIILFASNLLLGFICAGLVIWLYVQSNRDKNRLGDVQDGVESLRNYLMDSELIKQKNSLALLEATRNAEDLDLVSSVLETATYDDSKLFADGLRQAGQLLSEMNDVEPADFGKWKTQQQRRINSVLENHQPLQKEAEDLRSKLIQANAMIHSLQQRLKQEGSTQEQLDAANEPREQLNQKLDRNKWRRAQLETELQSIREDETQLRQQLAGERERFFAMEAMARQNEQQLMGDLASARAKYDEIKSVLDRTMMEKSFIETAYIRAEEAAESS
jgi:chromosome segregation ATPase